MSEALVDPLARARRAYQFVKTNLIAGLVFMVPLAVLVFFGAKIVGLLQRLAKPLAALFPVETTVWGVVVADAIVVALLLLACFLCGLLTRVSLATHGIVDLYLERLASRVAGRGLVADTPIEVHVAAPISAANESGD